MYIRNSNKNVWLYNVKKNKREIKKTGKFDKKPKKANNIKSQKKMK